MAFRVPFTFVQLAMGEVGDKSIEEAAQMSAMLEPITVEEANARQLDLVRGGLTLFTPEDEGHLFKCHNWDEETRMCGIYEDRPPMCRTFPYGEPCRYGCTCFGEVPEPEVIT